MIMETLVVVLLVLWLVGLVLGQTFGSIWHALLLVAVVMFAYRLITDRRVA
ncbi:MAG: lmo0937 family membrane protein [Acidobacteriota bacterium]